jgi:hypothetical protein
MQNKLFCLLKEINKRLMLIKINKKAGCGGTSIIPALRRGKKED